MSYLAEAPQLLLTCGLMLFGSLFAGALPYMLQVSDLSFRKVESMGAGLLIGTALAVVIPEGFAALSQEHHHQEHHEHAESITVGPDTGFAQHAGILDALPNDKPLAEWIPGAVLCAGFVAMLLLEHLQHSTGHGDTCSQSGKHKSSPTPSSDLGPYVDAGHLDQRRFHHLDAESGGSECVPDSAHQRVRKGNSALVGLVVHAAADGLAVGAASMSPSTRLALLVGVAMVLHKGPVAFGLTTFLRGCKWSWREIGRGLLIFSLSSSLVAILTYTLLRNLPGLTSTHSVALCVLFSGGTFLYAACMHILPHVLNNHLMASIDMLIFCCSCFIPVVMSMGHQH